MHFRLNIHVQSEIMLQSFLQDFKGVVPPIPVFDRLNDTYSQGEVGLTNQQ